MNNDEALPAQSPAGKLLYQWPDHWQGYPHLFAETFNSGVFHSTDQGGAGRRSMRA
jgi:hypothetical protein